jgi:cytochrome c nitrite reductase small subunit
MSGGRRDARRAGLVGPDRRVRAAGLIGTLAALFGVGAGLAAGVGGYVFVYAEGASYLTDVPDACANCHVMAPHLDAWAKSSHHAVAVCNDCHAPRGLFGKYTVKAINGYNHSLAFVSGDFKEPFQITPMNRRVTESACRVCHAEIVEAIDHPWTVGDETLSCVRCHAYVGHRVQ